MPGALDEILIAAHREGLTRATEVKKKVELIQKGQYALKNAKAALLSGCMLQCTLALVAQEFPDNMKICTRRQNE